MSEPVVLRPLDMDQNLLFALLTLQLDLIDNQQFAEAWATWSARGDRPVPELLVQRGWLKPEGRTEVERAMSRKLLKHGGNTRAALAELVNNPLQEALSGLAGSSLEKFLGQLGNGAVQPARTARPEAAPRALDDRELRDDFQDTWHEADSLQPWTQRVRLWVKSHPRLVQSTAAIAVAVMLASAFAVLILTPQNQRENVPQRRQEAQVPNEDHQQVEIMMLRVRALFSALIRKDDVLDHLRKDGTLTKREREVALTLARNYQVDANDLNNKSWFIVCVPDAGISAYRRALLLAEEACRLEPRSGFYLNTLGVAQYRMGQYAEAVKTLETSDEINSAGPTGPLPDDAAFLAMAYHRLGDKDKAKSTFRRLTSLMNDRSRLLKRNLTAQHIQEEQSFLSEAGKVLSQPDR
jgi:tetratricopeptide (TPR) repeat protein